MGELDMCRDMLKDLHQKWRARMSDCYLACPHYFKTRVILGGEDTYVRKRGCEICGSSRVCNCIPPDSPQKIEPITLVYLTGEELQGSGLGVVCDKLNELIARVNDG